MVYYLNFTAIFKKIFNSFAYGIIDMKLLLAIAFSAWSFSPCNSNHEIVACYRLALGDVTPPDIEKFLIKYQEPFALLTNVIRMAEELIQFNELDNSISPLATYMVFILYILK